MAEYIDREDLIKNLNKFAPEHYTALVNQIITKQPTADVVEVVRCSKCKYRKDDGDYITGHYCSKRNVNGGRFCRDNDFCSYGERIDT